MPPFLLGKTVGIDGFEIKFDKHSGQRNHKESRYWIVDVDPELVGGNSIVGMPPLLKGGVGPSEN